MPLDEAVALLAGTDVIAPGSRLDEARRTVLARVRERPTLASVRTPGSGLVLGSPLLAELEHLRAIKRRAEEVRDNPAYEGDDEAARHILGETS